MQIVPVDQIPLASDIAASTNLVEVYKTCLLMEAVCTENNGIGLSAVQVGIAWNLFIVRVIDNKYEYFVNCKYEPEGDEKVRSVEGCLSLRNPDGSLRYFQVERHKKIRLKGSRLKTRPKLELAPVNFVEVDPLWVTVYQHESDHRFGREKMVDIIGKEIELRK